MLLSTTWRRSLIGIAAVLLSSQTLLVQAASQFTATQQEQIGKIALQYFLDHPENLQLIAEKLQQKQQIEALNQMRDAVVKNADLVLKDPQTPAVGPQNAKVAVIEFFDYQCVFCAKTAPVVEKVIAANPNVRFIFKEFPIFGSRWPASVTAAQNGLTVYAKRGGKAYLDYHNHLYALNKIEGALEKSDSAKIALKTGLTDQDLDNNRINADATLNNTLKLAQALGVMGTPTFIIMPTKNANANNIVIISGATDQAHFDQAIKQATSHSI